MTIHVDMWELRLLACLVLVVLGHTVDRRLGLVNGGPYCPPLPIFSLAGLVGAVGLIIGSLFF